MTSTSPSNDDKNHNGFNQTMARLHAREQALAASLDELDKDIQQFRRDVVAFHARRAYVWALLEQEAHTEDAGDAMNAGDAVDRSTQQEAENASTQMIGAPVTSHQNLGLVDRGAQVVAPAFVERDAPATASIYQDDQRVAHGFVDQDTQGVAPATAPSTATATATATGTAQYVNPVVDDEESLFIPDQARSNEEHINALISRPKRRRVTFADDADVINDGNASSRYEESMAQKSDIQSVTAPKALL